MWKISKDGTIDARCYYPIGESAQLTGISRRTLLDWTKLDPPKLTYVVDELNRKQFLGEDLIRLSKRLPSKKR